MTLSLFSGVLAGALTGAATRFLLCRVFSSPDKKFYAVWGLGIALRFSCVLAAVLILFRLEIGSPAAFAAAMILSQTVFCAVPFKENA